LARRFLICLAFATWCFLNTWVQYAEADIAYFARQDPVRAVVIPVVCLEAIVAFAMFAVWEFCRRRALTRALPIHFLFLTGCLVPMGITSVAVLRILPFDATSIVRNRLFWPVALVLAIPPIVFALRRAREASWIAREAFLFSWLALIVLLVQSARGTLFAYSREDYADKPLAVPVSSPSPSSGIRVVWIVFDEMSQTVAFTNRPADLKLPNFDRLENSTFHATSAEAPGNATKYSMPGLILGERVTEVQPRDPTELNVRIGSTGELRPWSKLPNVFDEARGLGYDTAVAGWYLPYGRSLHSSLTRCFWTPGWLPSGAEERFEPQPLAAGMRDRLRLQFMTLPLVGHMPGVRPDEFEREEEIGRFSFLRGHALDLVVDRAMGLVLIHLPVPHPPAIYNRRSGAFTADDRASYLDGLALADRTLGELRAALEQSGLWDRTALLVSADHGWRTHLWRGDAQWTAEEEVASRQDTSGVPFLLKLPGQSSGSVYTKPFNTVLTRRLITAILSGRLKDPDALAGMIESSSAGR
jgi:hypothetical protein